MSRVIDPLKVIMDELVIPPYKKEDTALLVVDMQYYDAAPDYGLVVNSREQGVDVTYYCERLALITENIAKLIAACREKEVPVMYCTIESLTYSGIDRSPMHKAVGLNAQPGSRDGQILEELAPLPGEIVLKKTCSGVFNGTHIDQILHNMGVKNLIIVGVVTNQCVDTAVRDAADRGYNVTLLEDCTAAFHPTLQQASIEILGDIYARISTAADAIENVRANN